VPEGAGDACARLPTWLQTRMRKVRCGYDAQRGRSAPPGHTLPASDGSNIRRFGGPHQAAAGSGVHANRHLCPKGDAHLPAALIVSPRQIGPRRGVKAIVGADKFVDSRASVRSHAKRLKSGCAACRSSSNHSLRMLWITLATSHRPSASSTWCWREGSAVYGRIRRRLENIVSRRTVRVRSTRILPAG